MIATRLMAAGLALLLCGTAAAAKTYQQIEKILNDDVARIYVLHSLQPKAFNKKVRGFVNPHSWAYTFHNVWLAG